MIDRSTFKELKKLTGYSYEDVGEEFGLSRQAVNLAANNYSVVYQASNLMMILTMADKKINELQEKIVELKGFKAHVKTDFKNETNAKMTAANTTAISKGE